MRYGLSILGIIPVRKEPDERSEMVSQILFGESYEVIDRRANWLQVVMQFDAYQGWIDRKLFTTLGDAAFKQYSMHSPPVLEATIMEIEMPGSGPMLIPAGSSLPGFSGGEGTLDLGGRIFKVTRVFDRVNPHQRQGVETLAEKFINAPYLWGGRSVFGFDCSGYVQVVFKILGIALHRDASQQALQGRAVSAISEILPGDLAFFTGDNGIVNHVGIALSPDTIIHCSGFVRKDKLDEQGIYNEALQKYTHHLRQIRRIML
jgi:hypothetical protein